MHETDCQDVLNGLSHYQLDLTGFIIDGRHEWQMICFVKRRPTDLSFAFQMNSKVCAENVTKLGFELRWRYIST